MKLRGNIILIGAVAVVLAAVHTVAAGSARQTSADGLPQQNIFDLRRRATITNNPPPVIYFKLTGTMSYDGRSLAFFDGTNRRLQNKVLTPGEKMGGYTITDIANDSIKLQAPGQAAVTLRVGARLAELAANSSKEIQ